MIQVFGEFLLNLPETKEYLIVGFSPSSIPLKQRWHTNGLSADFLADYMTTFFPSRENDRDSITRRIEVKGAVSYIANELLENAMKFNDDSSGEPIGLSLHLRSDRIIFLVSNSVAVDAIEGFQNYISKLTTLNPQELYIDQLESNALEEKQSSHLGYLTMMVDYEAKLGWKFEKIREEPETIMVTTMVQLEV
ncbi:ATP-binding protein [Oscillatoria sp. FACHB-1406]|uniref:slr1658 superfamily regulator n=1 Tax=Oscillatoria sp. FACHB-1406 TaxID=2692846 RepID=UPI001689BB56|nr:ATP-binding protein [Oscillatoria sp. FACHB-1406]MBD2579950.1 ATP-binding protein [Oscillatoria sp. FACHB-1406]